MLMSSRHNQTISKFGTLLRGTTCLAEGFEWAWFHLSCFRTFWLYCEWCLSFPTYWDGNRRVKIVLYVLNFKLGIVSPGTRRASFLPGWCSEVFNRRQWSTGKCLWSLYWINPLVFSLTEYGHSLSSSEPDVSTSTENLSPEERYALEHTQRQEPQGQENVSTANMANTPAPDSVMSGLSGVPNHRSNEWVSFLVFKTVGTLLK